MRFGFRPVDVDTDLAVLHEWVTAPHARFWLMQGFSPAQVADAYREIAASPTHEAFLGLLDGEPRFLTERYDPASDPVGRVYDVRPGDIGMHLLVGPTAQPVPGFTTAVMRAVMGFCFADPAVARVVVEPDAANTAIHVLNERVGFEADHVVDLDGKSALLSFCTRERFTATLEGSTA